MALIVVSAASTLFIAASTGNYLSFYTGLDQINARVTSMTYIPPTTSNAASILANALVDNPSGYSGFRVSLQVSTYFLPSNMSNSPLFLMSPIIFSTAGWTSLPPRSHVALRITAILVPEDIAPMSQYLTFNSGNITAHTTLEFFISTFLDAALTYINTNPTGTIQTVPLAIAT